jgi:LysR family transcriptional regulator, nitrogen assimilation regulatory protein
MNLKQLVHFQSVASHGSITTAAARCNIAQSALSSQIAALEADLGVQLLVRHARGVTLTLCGEVLLDHAKQISAHLEKARREVRDAAAVAGEVTIGIPVSMASVLTLPLLQALETEFLGAQVHVFEGLTGDLRGWLRSGKIDTGILYGDDQADGLSLTELAEDELVLFGKVGDEWLGRPSISFDALPRWPIYTTDGEHPVRPLLSKIAKNRRLALQFGAQINSVGQLKALAREGRGHTILPRVALASEGPTESSQILSIEPPIKLRSYIATKTNPSRSVRKVEQVLRQVVQHLIKNNDWPGAVLLHQTNRSEDKNARSAD